MASRNAFRLFVIGVAFLAASSAFAGNQLKLHVFTQVSVAGKTIPEGDYTFKWEESAAGVEVKILNKDYKVIATAPAKWVTLDKASPYDALLIRNDSGVQRLFQIQLSGKKAALQMEPESGALHEPKSPGSGYLADLGSRVVVASGEETMPN